MNKRIQYNEKIHKKLNEIESEYIKKIQSELVNLTNHNQNTAHLLTLVTIWLSYIPNTEYNDREFKHRLEYENHLKSLTPDGFLKDVDIPPIIRKLAKEGTTKINRLQWRLKPPKKRLTLDTAKTEEDFFKLEGNFVNEHLDGRMSRKEFNENIDKLNILKNEKSNT